MFCFLLDLTHSSLVFLFFFVMRRRPPRSTRTDTLFPTRRSSDLAPSTRVRPDGSRCRGGRRKSAFRYGVAVRCTAPATPGHGRTRPALRAGKIGSAHV